MLSLTEPDFVVSSPPDDPRPLFVRPSESRDWAPVAARSVLSLAAHVVIASFLVVLNPWRPHTIRPLFSAPPLARVVYIPIVPVDLPALDLPKLSAPEEVVAAEPKPALPEPVPVKPIETVAVEAPVVKPVPVVAEAPRTPPPAPVPPPSPTLGLFPEATAATRTPVVTRQVEAAGFDAPVKQTAESKPGQATVGAFDTAPQSAQRQTTNAVVTDSGFGRTMTANTSAQPARAIRETGFGDSASREQPKAKEPSEVKQAGFSNAAATDAPRRVVAAPAAPVTTPVEVLSKPTPVYTDQARKLKIEGEVVLEVEFSASGSLRVVRVVRGLGYGLDEAAVKAAEQIQFKPARNGGGPVDFRTTVQIVFRLA